MDDPNQKHHNFNDDLLPVTNDIFKPEFKRDTRGRYFMQLPGYGKWMVSVEPGSKIISQGSEDEQGGPATDPGSIRTGSLHATTVITIGESIALDGSTGCIHVGNNYAKRIGTSMSLCGSGLTGYSDTELVFGFFLEDYEYTDLITFGKGDVIIGDRASDNYILWDDSAGYLYVRGDILVEGDIISANYVTTVSGYKLTYATGEAEFQQGLIGGWEIDTCLKKEYTISSPSKSKIELCPGNPGHLQAAYSATGSFSLPGDVYMVQITQGSTADAGGVPIPRLDIYNDGVKRMMLNSDGLYFFDADGTTVNNKIELTQARLKDVVIESGAIAATSEPSIQGWSHNIVFSVTDADTVAWSSGTITLTNGDSFAINAGNTGNMSASTYVYLSKDTSLNTLQTTTTAGTAVGSGKILIAFAKNSTNEALFQVFGGIGGIKMNGLDLENLTVDTEKIAALAIEEAKLGNLSVSSGKIIADAVTASKINVVGLDGTSGRIVVTDATDANEVTGGINSHATTLITAGKIVISGSTNLDDWRNGTDSTKIEGGNIYTNTITATQIAANTITATQIASNTITASEIAANTIRASEISTAIISSGKVTASYLTASNIQTGTLSAITVQTSSGSSRIKLISDNIEFYSGSALKATIDGTTAGNGGVRSTGDWLTANNKAFWIASSTGGSSEYGGMAINSSNQLQLHCGTNNSFYVLNNSGTSMYVFGTSTFTVGSSTYSPDIIPGQTDVQDLGSASKNWDDVYCNTTGNASGNAIWFDQAGRVQVDNHFDPSGAGSYNMGGASRYWNYINTKEITKQGGGGWGVFDNGVELQDGRIVSDTEALLQMKPHPTNKTSYGKPHFKLDTLPKAIYVPPTDNKTGKILPKDSKGNFYKMEDVKQKNGSFKKEKVIQYEGENVFATISILIGAVRELTQRLKELEK